MASLATGIAATYHTPAIDAWIGDVRVQPIRAVVEVGYDSVSSSAILTLASVPSSLAFRQSVKIQLGYAGYSPATIPVFTGFVEDDDREFVPLEYKVKGAGRLKNAQYQYPTEVTYTSQTDTAIVQDLLSKAGVNSYDVEGDGTTLGAVEDVVLQAGQAPWDLINQLDQLFGYKTWDAPDGSVRRRLITGIPGNSAAFAYVEGTNIFRISRPRTVRGIHNKIIVNGLPQDPSTPSATRVADNPLVPNPPQYIAYRFDSDLIESDAVASAVALRLIGEMNRVVEEIRLEVPGNPYLVPGMTVTVTSGRIGLSSATPFFVRHVKHTFDEKGFVSELTVEGGIGEAGYELGKPPLAMFAYRVSKENYEIAGTPTDMYTVSCDGSSSTDPDSPPDSLTYAWENNKNADTGTGTLYSTTFTQAEMDDATEPSITLTVTDPDGNADALTLTMYVDIEEILTRDLYVAESGRAEATPDGGTTRNTWTPGAGTVISTPEIAGEDHSYFGLSDGKLYYTDDYLAMAPTEVHDFGSQVNCIWINESNADRVTVGLDNGEIWRTEDASLLAAATWALLTTYGSAVLKVKESPLWAGQYWVCEGTDVRTTVDDFASDSQFATWATGTAREVITSFYAKYGAATHANPVKRDDGTEITFSDGTADVRALTHHINDDIIYAAALDADTTTCNFYSKAAGATAFTLIGTIADAGQPNHMIRDGDNPLEIYLACDGGLYKTFDGGASFVRMWDLTGAGLSGLQVGYGSAQWVLNPGATIVSNTTDTVCLDLDNGASFNDPPASWRDSTYDDSAWAATVEANSPVGTPPAGSTAVWKAATPIEADERVLFRHPFTLDPGFITTATLTVNVSNVMIGFWINNMFVWQREQDDTMTEVEIDVDPAILLPGEANVLAAQCQSVSAAGTVVKVWTAVGAGAGYSGVRRYTVSGSTMSADAATVDLGYEVVAIKVFRGNYDVCYAVTRDVAGDALRVHKTTDGVNWSVVYTLSGITTAGTTLRVSPDALFVSPTNSNRVWFGTQGKISDAKNGIFLSTDGGANFTMTSVGHGGGAYPSQTTTYAGIWGVFEDSGGTVWTFHDHLGAGADDAKAFSKSTNGGVAWTDFTTGHSSWDTYLAASVTWSDDGTKMFAIGQTPGGPDKYTSSVDGGANWVSGVDTKITNWTQAIGAFCSISILDNARWYVGQSHTATAFTNGYSLNTGGTWSFVTSTGVAHTAILASLLTLSTVYAFGASYGGSGKYGLVSTDDGATWTTLTGGEAFSLASLASLAGQGTESWLGFSLVIT